MLLHAILKGPHACSRAASALISSKMDSFGPNMMPSPDVVQLQKAPLADVGTLEDLPHFQSRREHEPNPSED